MFVVNDHNKYRLTQGLNLNYQPFQADGSIGEKRRSRNPWTVCPALMRELQKYDYRLKVVWDEWKERWCIWRESGGADYFVYTVEGPNGEYRDLDLHLVQTLLSFDSGRYTSPHAMAAMMEEEEEADRERILQSWRNEFDYATHHNRKQLAEAVEAAASGLPPGEPEKPQERRKPKEKIIYDAHGREKCRVTCSTEAPKTSKESMVVGATN